MFYLEKLPKLKPYEWSEYCLLILISVFIPISWDLATKGLFLLFIHTIIKQFFQERVGNPQISIKGRLCLGLLSAYFLVYLISLLYSFNIAEGIDEVLGKLPFLFIPLIFILSDTSYLKPKHLRLIIYTFIASISVRFFTRLTITIFKCVSDKSLSFFSIVFDEFHHTYLAMYILFALLFLYWDFLKHGDKYPQWGTKTLIAIVFTLIADLILIQSRTGILGLILIGLFVIIHLVLSKHRYRLALALIFSAIAGAFIISSCLPDKTHRLSETLSELTTNNHKDERFYITKTTLLTIKEHPFYGVGAGDRIDVLYPHYQDAPLSNSLRDHDFNPHNMYLDTRLAVGIVGLIILLAILLCPLLIPQKTSNKEQFILFTILLLPVAFSGLFESILERQMGILFLCYFYCLIFSTQYIENDSSI